MRMVNRIIERLLFTGTALSAMLFFAVVLFAVITRYVFHVPLLASIELSRLFFVWSCFLAAAITYRRKAHVGFTLLYEYLPPVVRKVIRPMIGMLIALFAGMVFWQGIVIIRLLWLTDLPMLGISQGWFYVPLPVTSAAILSYSIESILDDLSGRAAEA